MKHLFTCTHCFDNGWHGFASESPAVTREHEKTCEYNITSRTCATCSELDMDDCGSRNNLRPKCMAYGDRKYRRDCLAYKPSDWVLKRSSQ